MTNAGGNAERPRTDPQPSGRDAGRAGAAGLAREVAAAQRQLRDLTEQSLGFLEELAEARRQLHDRQVLAERVEELERLVADTQRRLRTAGGYARSPADEGAIDVPPLEVVFWGEGAGAAARAAKEALPDLPVSLVATPRQAKAADETETEESGRDDAAAGDGVQRFAHQDARTPAQCWNLAMAVTRAEFVLVLSAECALDELPELPAAAADPGGAILCPRLVSGGREVLGFTEDDLLLVQPAPPPPAGDAVLVAFATPDAFVLRRAAFDRIGLFHEELVGPAALFEYALRARGRGFTVLGLPSLAVAAGDPWDPLADETFDADRLLVLAMHRPGSLGAALAGAESLWRLDADAAPDFVARLLARLPADGPHGAAAMLVRIAQSLVQHGAPRDRVLRLLQERRSELLRTLAADAPAELRADVAHALQRAGQPPITIDAAFDELARDEALAARARAALRQAFESAAAQVESLRRRLAEAESARAEAESLRRRLAETESALAAEVEAAAGARAEGKAASAVLAATQRELEAMRQSLDSAQQEVERRRRALRSLGAAAGIEPAPSGEGDEHLDRLYAEVAGLRRRSAQLAEAQALAGAADAEALRQAVTGLPKRLAELEERLADRERWIALLLAEATKRRLFPRALAEHERAFLAQRSP